MVIIFLVTFVLQDFLPPNGDSSMSVALEIIENSSVIFFTIEYVIRFMCSPNKTRFLKNAMNMVDLLAIIPFYVSLLLDQIDDIAILGKAGKAVRLLRVLRIIRIFKLVRHFAGLQSLMHTVYEAYKELGLLMLLVLLAELTFAVLIFFAEKDTPKTTNSIFKHDDDHSWSFVECLWFCLMTLTTVGDDRKYPSSRFGQMIGGVCAVMGVFIISLPIPIVVNSFARSYRSQLWRNEVAHRRMATLNQIKQKRMMEKAKGRLINCTSNTITTILSTLGQVGISDNNIRNKEVLI